MSRSGIQGIARSVKSTQRTPRLLTFRLTYAAGAVSSLNAGGPDLVNSTIGTSLDATKGVNDIANGDLRLNLCDSLVRLGHVSATMQSDTATVAIDCLYHSTQAFTNVSFIRLNFVDNDTAAITDPTGVVTILVYGYDSADEI